MISSGGPTPATRSRVSVLDVLVFLDELVLLAVFAVAGADLGASTVLGVTLAVVLPLVAGTVWAAWLAPRATRRLTGTAGLSTRLALFTLAAVLLAFTGMVPWASVFWGLSVLLLVVAEIAHPDAQSPRQKRSGGARGGVVVGEGER